MSSVVNIDIDGSRYCASFLGFDRPLTVHLPDGQEVCFDPWSFACHMRALGRHTSIVEHAFALDAAGYAEEVLRLCCRPAIPSSELRPLALWWAAGGGDTRFAPDSNGWLELGPVRAQLRPWTVAERAEALADCIEDDGSGGTVIDIVGYVDRMLRATVTQLEPGSFDLSESDARTTHALLDATMTVNAPLSELHPALDPKRPAARELMRGVLRACRALGWTPSAVLAMPARDLDAVMAWSEMAGDATVCSRSTGDSAGSLSHSPAFAHPDAVVIRIEDDPS